MRTLRLMYTAMVCMLRCPAWATTGIVVLITFSSAMLPRATADVPNPIPDPGITASTITIIPNHATYTVSGEDILGHTPVQKAPFGSGGACSLQSTVNSDWPTDSTIILRKSFTLPADAINLRVLLSIDNDATVLINDKVITQPDPLVHDFCPIVDEFVLNAANEDLLVGTNHLEVRATDRGVESFVDLRVLVDRADTDNDGVPDADDNCPEFFNPDLKDFDFDGVGDPCDNCVIVPNDDQTDSDGDGIGDACDSNEPPPADTDGDGVPNGGDNCIFIPNDQQTDSDFDGVGDACDNCVSVPNGDQTDSDGDAIGDACDDP